MTPERARRYFLPPSPYGRRRRVEIVGASVWQTPGGVQAELSRINDDILAFSAEIAGYVAAHDPASPDATPRLIEDTSFWSRLAGGGISALRDTIAEQVNAAHTAAATANVHPTTTDPHRAAVASFYLLTWIPFVGRWIQFYENNKGWTDNLWWNHAPEAEQFADQLVQIRAAAQRLGMPVLSPAPSKWGKSLLDPGRDPVKPLTDLTDAIMLAAKIALFGGLGIAGVIGISMAVKSVRK